VRGNPAEQKFSEEQIGQSYLLREQKQPSLVIGTLAKYL
jgi:hypothetical protein